MVFTFHLHVAAVLPMQGLSDGLTKTFLLPLPSPPLPARIAKWGTNKLYLLFCVLLTVHTLLNVTFLARPLFWHTVSSFSRCFFLITDVFFSCTLYLFGVSLLYVFHPCCIHVYFMLLCQCPVIQFDLEFDLLCRSLHVKLNLKVCSLFISTTTEHVHTRF